MQLNQHVVGDAELLYCPACYYADLETISLESEPLEIDLDIEEFLATGKDKICRSRALKFELSERDKVLLWATVSYCYLHTILDMLVGQINN